MTGLELPEVIANRAGGDAVLADLLEGMRRDALAAMPSAEAEFRDWLRLSGIGGEWRSVEGVVWHQVALHARYADLVVVGQEDPDSDRPGAGAVVEQAVFTSGRPVLVVPFAGRFETVGRKVLIGWKASREAARAVNDALPVIAQAETATVLAVIPRSGLNGLGEEPGADIALHLARHGVKVEVQHTVEPETGDAEAILNVAADLSADLLVVGAYGHSRLREMALGGVTRTLLRHMRVPVLMSH